MPKIIVDIEDRIFLSAKELFYEKGYEQVNMKEIAKRAGMAVGTLYNYFSRKNELYFSVLEKSWNATFEKLEDLQGIAAIDKEERLRSSITLIYEDIVDRRCMGIQVRQVKDLQDDTSIAKIEQKIVVIVKTIFTDFTIQKEVETDEHILDKIVYSLLITMTMLVDYYPEDSVNNIEYLYRSVVGYLVI